MRAIKVEGQLVQKHPNVGNLFSAAVAEWNAAWQEHGVRYSVGNEETGKVEAVVTPEGLAPMWAMLRPTTIEIRAIWT